jgi:hypothetical protein
VQKKDVRAPQGALQALLDARITAVLKNLQLTYEYCEGRRGRKRFSRRVTRNGHQALGQLQRPQFT